MTTSVPVNGQPFVIVPSLTRIAMAVQQPGLIADAVCPRVSVAGELFEYTKVSTKEMFSTPDDLIGRTGAANQIEFSSSDETDRVIDRGLEAPVPIKDVEAAGQANMADPRGLAVEQLTQVMLLNREVRVASLLFDTNNYAAALKVTLDDTAGKYRWDNATNGDPITYLENAIAGMIVQPDTLVVGYNVWLAIKRHSKTISRLYGSASTRGTAMLGDVAAELGLNQVAVGSAFKDSTAKGQTASLARVWGNYAALIRVGAPVSGRMVQPTFAFTAQYEGRVAGTYFDPKRGKKGVDVIKVTESVKELVSWQAAGYLFTTPITP